MVVKKPEKKPARCLLSHHVFPPTACEGIEDITGKQRQPEIVFGVQLGIFIVQQSNVQKDRKGFYFSFLFGCYMYWC
jgi:hypothetical protein